jgi:hypothetical protein
MTPDECADYIERRVCTVGGVDIAEPVAEALRRLGRLERVLREVTGPRTLVMDSGTDGGASAALGGNYEDEPSFWVHVDGKNALEALLGLAERLAEEEQG